MPEDDREVTIAGETQKWFTMIPNMVDDMRLDPYAFRLYCHIRRVAGEGGKCYQSSRYLAEVCQMSVAKISEAKQTLVNAGLIDITRTWIGEGKIGRDHIKVVDIWRRNFERYGQGQDECQKNGSPRSVSDAGASLSAFPRGEERSGAQNVPNGANSVDEKPAWTAESSYTNGSEKGDPALSAESQERSFIISSKSRTGESPISRTSCSSAGPVTTSSTQRQVVIAERTLTPERVIAVRTQADRSLCEHKSDRCAIPKEEPVLKKNPVGEEGRAFSDSDLPRLWSDCRQLLEPTIGVGSFVWLRDAELVAIRDGEAVIAVTTENARQMCAHRLWRSVGEALEQAGIEAAPVFVVAEKEAAPRASPVVSAGPDLTALWKSVLGTLREQGVPVKELASAHIQTFERAGECKRAVVLSAKQINPNQFCLPVANALTQLMKEQVIVNFLTA